MEIIAELEPDRRGPYGGAVGYFDFSGNMDTAITIRTIVMKDGVAHIQAGGGIVYDSVPETEYQETLNKARAMLRAIDQAELMEEEVPAEAWGTDSGAGQLEVEIGGWTATRCPQLEARGASPFARGPGVSPELSVITSRGGLGGTNHLVVGIGGNP